MEKENISSLKPKKPPNNLKNIHKINKRPPLTAANNNTSQKKPLIKSKQPSVTSTVKSSSSILAAVNVKAKVKNDPSAPSSSKCAIEKEENSISNFVPVNNSFNTNISNLNLNQSSITSTNETNNNNPATSNSINLPEDNTKIINNNVLTNIFNDFESSSMPSSIILPEVSVSTTTTIHSENKANINYAHVKNDCNGQINTNNCRMVSNVDSINPMFAVLNDDNGVAVTISLDDDNDNMKIVNNKNSIDNTIEMVTEINDVRISNVKQVKYLSFTEGEDDIDEIKGDLFNCTTTANSDNSLLDDDTLDLIEIFLENKVKFINYVDEFLRKVNVCAIDGNEQHAVGGGEVNYEQVDGEGQMVQQENHVEQIDEVNRNVEIVRFNEIEQNDEVVDNQIKLKGDLTIEFDKTDENDSVHGNDQIDQTNETVELELGELTTQINQQVETTETEPNQQNEEKTNVEQSINQTQPPIRGYDGDPTQSTNSTPSVPSTPHQNQPQSERKVNTASKIPVRADVQLTLSTPKHVQTNTPVFQRPQSSKQTKKAQTKLQFF